VVKTVFIVLYNSKSSQMKKYILFFIAIIPLSALAQQSDYIVSSYLTEGTKAPNTHYIGEAWLNNLLPPDSTLNYIITKATFRANSTLDWHKHGSVQILIIVEGEAYYQERGKEPVVLKKGDVIKCNSNTEHWHASTKHTSVTYLAIYGGSQPTTWTEKLTQEYYDGVAVKLSGKK
jgi:quercetin dioxygenase-like cupin family protein